jgi:hypothetical protein
MTPLEQISADLGWRESELGSLKILLGRRDLSKTQQAVLLRASWAMLYAHYEGFVKTALTIFYDEVCKKITDCDLLPKETRAKALVMVIKKTRSLPAIELLDEIEDFRNRHHKNSPEFPEVETKSNLWPSLLEDLLKSADIESDIVIKHKFKIKTLVARRNEIAHGKQDLISEVSYYTHYEAVVYDIMYEIAFLIDERLNKPPYL